MKQYLCGIVDGRQTLMERLNSYAEDGWRVVAVYPATAGLREYVLERDVDDDDDRAEVAEDRVTWIGPRPWDGLPWDGLS